MTQGQRNPPYRLRDLVVERIDNGFVVKANLSMFDSVVYFSPRSSIRTAVKDAESLCVLMRDLLVDGEIRA
jgi:hypothetical protein